MLALHEEMAQSLRLMFNYEKIEIIRNGIDFKRFANCTYKKNEVRKSLNICEDAFVVGHVGRFSDQKNHSFIIDVFKELKEKRNNAFLLLIGAGELMESIENKIKSLEIEDSVMILSHRSDIPELMKSMDVFLFPSKYEGLPVTLIEAQVSGLPCVVSNSINKAALLQPNVVALDLKDAIKKWVDYIEAMSSIDKVEYTEELNKYDMNKEILKLESIYIGK